MCGPHWRLVPGAVKTAVNTAYAAYRRLATGQVAGDRAAFKAAVDALRAAQAEAVKTLGFVRLPG